MIKRSNFIFIFAFLAGLMTLQGCLKSSALKALNQKDFTGAISAINLSGTVIQVSWNAPSDSSISGFKVYSVDTNHVRTFLADLSASTSKYEDTVPEAGKIYRYIVHSVSSQGVEDTNSITVSALAYQGITSATVTDANKVTLYFPAAADADGGFNIYCAQGFSGTMIPMANVPKTETSHQLSNLNSNGTYICLVKAVFGTIEDSNTLRISFTLQAVGASSPLGFAGITSAVNNNDGSSVVLKWNHASGATVDHYTIFQINDDETVTSYEIGTTDVGNPLTCSTTAVERTCTVTGLTSGQNYGFEVRAVDSSGATDGNSVVKMAFTYSGIYSVTPGTAGAATIYFPAAINASSLHVYCYQSSGTKPSTPTATISDTSTVQYSLRGLVHGTPYTCQVNAVGMGGEDSNTVTQSFTP